MDLVFPPHRPLDAGAQAEVEAGVATLVNLWRSSLVTTVTPEHLAAFEELFKQWAMCYRNLGANHSVICGQSGAVAYSAAWSVNLTHLALASLHITFEQLTILRSRDLPRSHELVIPPELDTPRQSGYLRRAFNEYVEYLLLCMAATNQPGEHLVPVARFRAITKVYQATRHGLSQLELHVPLPGYPTSRQQLAWRYNRYNLVFGHLGLTPA